MTSFCHLMLPPNVRPAVHANWATWVIVFPSWSVYPLTPSTFIHFASPVQFPPKTLPHILAGPASTGLHVLPFGSCAWSHPGVWRNLETLDSAYQEALTFLDSLPALEKLRIFWWCVHLWGLQPNLPLGVPKGYWLLYWVTEGRNWQRRLLVLPRLY